MEEVNKNGWRKNFIDKIGETEKNLKKLDQSFNVTTKMSDLDNEYRLFRKKEGSFLINKSMIFFVVCFFFRKELRFKCKIFRKKEYSKTN